LQLDRRRRTRPRRGRPASARPAQQRLRRLVRGRAGAIGGGRGGLRGDRAGAGPAGSAGSAGQAEVDASELDAIVVAGEEDVGGLEVAVGQALVVHVRHGGGDAGGAGKRARIRVCCGICVPDGGGRWPCSRRWR
jgi:hypothetical protein